MKFKAALLLSLPLAALANCPNACSGHGNCNKASQCECYANFMSADCSERACSFGRAFIDTPLGDLDGASLVCCIPSLSRRLWQSQQPHCARLRHPLCSVPPTTLILWPTPDH